MNNEIASIIRTVLKNDRLELKDHYTPSDIEGWDSLHHVMIIAEVEKKFGIKFDFMEMLGIKSIADLSRVVKNKL